MYEAQPEDRTSCKATRFNNIAWMHASADPNSKDYRLFAAREALDQMKRVMSRDTWLPGFPTFFHTEAFLEFEEYKRDARAFGDKQAQKAKLNSAQDAIERALSARTNSIYTQLCDQIEGEVQKMSRDEARAAAQIDKRLTATY